MPSADTAQATTAANKGITLYVLTRFCFSLLSIAAILWGFNIGLNWIEKEYSDYFKFPSSIPEVKTAALAVEPPPEKVEEKTPLTLPESYTTPALPSAPDITKPPPQAMEAAAPTTDSSSVPVVEQQIVVPQVSADIIEERPLIGSVGAKPITPIAKTHPSLGAQSLETPTAPTVKTPPPSPPIYQQSTQPFVAPKPPAQTPVQEIKTTPPATIDAPTSKSLQPQTQIASAPAPVTSPVASGKKISDLQKFDGVGLIEAIIKPLEFELNERFWGWRPNDVVPVADNISHFQLGKLAVTRATVGVLAAKSDSSPGAKPHLQKISQLLMSPADKFWFPSTESQYKEALNELEALKAKLLSGQASMRAPTDTLGALFAEYASLLKASELDLVRSTDDDGKPIGLFKADDYFYHAKGAASAIDTILEAVLKSLRDILKTTNSLKYLAEAKAACSDAADVSPWVVTNGNLDGILANHRINLSLPISNARTSLDAALLQLSG